jgi:hypothetical protein
MVIWIVEDDDDDAGKAYDVVTQVAGEKTGKSPSHSVKIYRVKLIEWPPELRVLGESENRIETDIQKARPSIVILDIFDRGSFRAPEFLRGLREWEHNLAESKSTGVKRFRSFVILWTIWTNEDEVLSFLQQQSQRDRRISYTQTKNLVLLKDHLEGFWRRCDEEKNP